jgi:hypothetical protein
MRTELHEKLINLTQQLRTLLGSLATSAVAERAFLCIQMGPEAASETGLLAPYKQSFFMLGQMLTTSEPKDPAEFDDEKWRLARHLLSEIYALYAEIFWPTTEEQSSINNEWREHRSVVMPAFLQYWTSGTNASVEQLTQRVLLTLVPFDADLLRIVGLSATDALKISEWISKYLQQNLDAHKDFIATLSVIHKRFVTEKWGKKCLNIELARIAPNVVIPKRTLLAVEFSALKHQFGDERANAFWRIFVSERRSSDKILYITDENPAEDAPLFSIAPNEALCLVGNQLVLAILSKLGGALQSDEASSKRFIAQRDKALEQLVERVFRNFLGTEGQVYASACEQLRGQYEHDLVVVVGDQVFVVEAKARPPVEPFRDPEKAFTRISQAFRSDRGTQKAFEQANRLRQRLINKERVPLYDMNGNLLVSLDGQSIRQVHCICVTADDFGPLATDLSMLLEKKPSDPYPWAVNIFDLEAFLKALRKKNGGAEQLGDYLAQRSLLHGKVFAQDELEIGGIFILQGSLKDLLSQSHSKLFLSSGLSKIFDDLYIEEQGGPKAVLTPPAEFTITDLGQLPHELSRSEVANRVSKIVLGRALDAMAPNPHKKIGRNDPCPCGSGKKYKHCCL